MRVHSMNEESFYVQHVDWIVVDGAHTVESVNKVLVLLQWDLVK